VQLQPPFPENHVVYFADGKRVVVEGTLIRPPEKTLRSVRLQVEVHEVIKEEIPIATTGRILVSLPDLEQPLEYGDRLRFTSRLRHPTNFNNPGGFDYRRYLATRKIWVTSSVQHPKKIIRVARRQGNAFWAGVEALRIRIRTFLDLHASPSSRPILKALVLGERGTVPDQVKEDFAASGAAHIMAISGFHLGIIAFFFFRGLMWMLKRSERITLSANIFKLSATLTIPAIILYTLLAGSRVPTVRATVMIIVYLVSIILDRPRDLYHTLALAALVITLVDPASLLDASYQLSFTAVLAILFLFPKLKDLLFKEQILPKKQKNRSGRFVSRCRDLLIVSLAAMIGTGPLIAFHFNRVSPMGLVANFFVIPLLGFLAVPAALISALLSLCSNQLATPFVQFAGWIVDLTVFIIHGLASVPGAAFHVATPTLLEISLFYGFVALIFHAYRSVFCRIALLVILSLGVLDAGIWLFRTHFNQTLRITLLDVGQGDCALVEFPGGKKALIDGGGFYDDRFDIGKNVIAPFLWRKKIQKIDFLVLTHPDPDHLNGLKFIARTFRVDELWDSGLENTSPSFREFMSIVREKDIHRISLFRGDEPRKISGVIVTPLHPWRKVLQTPGPSPPLKANNFSLVLKLSYGRQSFLFTGDIEADAEAEIAASGVDLKSRVIKVPHHGSLTSSTDRFLSQVQPQVAVVSVGKRGMFHLPNEKVLDRYQRRGTRILRTDQHGAIYLETDGQSLRISSFQNPPSETPFTSPP
jgi:competence protein ComEC